MNRIAIALFLILTLVAGITINQVNQEPERAEAEATTTAPATTETTEQPLSPSTETTITVETVPVITATIPPTTVAVPSTTIPVPTTLRPVPTTYPQPVPTTTPVTQQQYSGGLPAFLICVRQRESRGNYQAYNPSGASGAFQLMPVTARNTALHAGRSDLAALPVLSWSPADQDAMAIHLLNWQGPSPWAGPGC